jgi:hypothetical protein
VVRPHSYGSHKLFDYARKRALSRAAARVGIDMERSRNQGLKKWWEMMTSLRQTMLNLLAAGLFHLVEQQLAALSRDNAISESPVTSTKLWDVAGWYPPWGCASRRWYW